MMRRRNMNQRPLRPVRRRQATGPRANRACVSCKEKKLKCDDNTPTCANCQRFGTDCLVEDPETKKQRPRNYVESLEQRLALHERQSAQHTSDTSGLSPGLHSNHGSQKTMPTFTSEEDNDGDSDLPSKVGFLDVKTTQVEPQYLGPSSAFSFAHIINASLRGAITQRPVPGQRGPNQAETAPIPCPFPEYNVAMKLSNAYFENIHPHYPFLHEPTFRHYEKMLIKQSSEIPNVIMYSVPLFFINMVYAVGALLVPGYQYLAEPLYSSAQLYPEVLSLDNLEAIQAILCYAMYSLRSANGPSLWKLSGLALRQCTELGYHRSAKRVRRNQSPLQVELRKRAFWCAQGIDVTHALRLGRPLGIQLHDVDTELPLNLDDALLTDAGILGTPRTSSHDAPTSMSYQIHVIRLRRIQSRIHACVHSATRPGDLLDSSRDAHIAQLRADLDEWRATAPEPSPRSGETLSIFSTQVWYDLNYSTTILHLYREQLAEGKGAPDIVFMDCMHASSTVCRLYRSQYVGTSINYTWGTLQCLFLAGLTYLHCLWTCPAALESVQHHDVSKTCTDCTMVLVVIAQGWNTAAPYRDIFEVLASRTLSMIVTRSCQQPLPAAAPLSDSSDREAVTRWMEDMEDTGMLDAFDGLLSGFMDDFTPYDINNSSF